jgi:hypothetical protein
LTSTCGRRRDLIRPGAGALLAIAVTTGCGGSRPGASTRPGRPAAIYATKWEPAFRLDASGRRVLSISRTALQLRLQVVDQTCHPNDPRFANAARRFAGAIVREQRAAVIVTMYMHPEPPVKRCVPAGVGFPVTVTLAHPVGARALVDGGTRPIGGGAPIAVIRIPAQSRALEREAEARYGRPDVAAVP